MTQQEAQLKRNVISLEPCFVQDAKMSKLINEIFDEHEAQIEAKDELLDKLHKAYAEAEYACKAKDEEIRRLNNLYADTIKEVGKLDEDYSKVAYDFESAVMDIQRLKIVVETLTEVISLIKPTKH